MCFFLSAMQQGPSQNLGVRVPVCGVDVIQQAEVVLVLMSGKCACNGAVSLPGADE